eukprot:TRINITY_DN1759_c0_g3_i2.p1 TRINITY_DN1759_c0_g3~~TRINITY_DN1759_c0_g3_i2.p1  ORF type:complete len:179 (-),score=8.81 TRINITY_DN1759_c0_g3_i2:218-754(-)
MTIPVGILKRCLQRPKDQCKQKNSELKATANPYSLPKGSSLSSSQSKSSSLATVVKQSGRGKQESNRFGGSKQHTLTAGAEEFKSDGGVSMFAAMSAMSSSSSKAGPSVPYTVAGEMYFPPSTSVSGFEDDSRYQRADASVSAGSGLYAHCIECKHKQQMTEVRSWTCSKCRSFNLIE